jgi:hypothetical protein
LLELRALSYMRRSHLVVDLPTELGHYQRNQ